MPEWNKQQFRFMNGGMNLNRPIDSLPDNQFAYLRNVRSYVEGRIESRPGHIFHQSFGGDQIHSLILLTNTSPDISAGPGMRFAHAGPNLHFGPAAAITTYSPCDSGYSEKPVSFVTASGISSPDPWLYVYDYQRQRRFSPGRLGGEFSANPGAPIPFEIGIRSPAATSRLNDSGPFQDFGDITFAAAGTVTTVPYFYRYQLRDPLTGTRSTPSPPTGYPDQHYGRVDRGGTGSATLTLPVAYLADHLTGNDGTPYICDIYRYGGNSTDWLLLDSVNTDAIETSPGVFTPKTYTDTTTDDQILGAPVLEQQHHQPWVTEDVYRKWVSDPNPDSPTKLYIEAADPTLNGHGSYLVYEWETHSPEWSYAGPNETWLPGTELVVSGNYEGTLILRYFKAYKNYATVNDAFGMPYIWKWRARMEVQEEVPATDPVGALTVTGALMASYNLQHVFGPFGSGFTGLYHFAVGDPRRPGTLLWTNANDPDSVSEFGYLDISDASDPLQNGCVYNGRVYVWSVERMWEVIPDLAAANRFVAQVLAGARGLFGPWCFAVGDFVYWRSKDGIYAFSGSYPTSITDAEVYPFFPHDGQPANTMVIPNGEFFTGHPDQYLTIYPPSDTADDLQWQRLCWADGTLYYDYRDTSGRHQTLVRMKLPGKLGGQSPQTLHGWGFDTFTNDTGNAIVHSYESTVHTLLAAYGTNLYQTGGVSDDGQQIMSAIETGASTLGDPRSMKLIGDAYIGAITELDNIAVFFLGTNNTRKLGGTAALNSNPYQQTLINIPDQDEHPLDGNGVLDRTCGLWAHWGSFNGTVELWDWMVTWIPRPDTIEKRTTDWDGDTMPKYVKGCVFRADVDPDTNKTPTPGEGLAIAGIPYVGIYLQTDAADPRKVHDPAFTFRPEDLNGVLKVTGGAGWEQGIYYIQGVSGGVLTLERPPAAAGATGGEWALGGNRLVNVYGDDGSFRQIQVAHPSETTLPYSWKPFVAYQMRLLPVDEGTCRIFPPIRWVYDPYADYSGVVGPITNLGYMGAKFVQGVRITADSQGVPVAYDVSYDSDPPTEKNITLHLPARQWDGKQTIPFSFTPFICHNLQLLPLGRIRSFYDEVEWVWEPVPELAQVWQTQSTNNNIAGFSFTRDAWVAYISHPDATMDETLTITTEYGSESYTLPLYTGTEPHYTRLYLPLKPQKAKWRDYLITSELGVRVYVKDTVVRVQAWGSGDFRWEQPFGDLSRAAGARI